MKFKGHHLPLALLASTALTGSAFAQNAAPMPQAGGATATQAAPSTSVQETRDASASGVGGDIVVTAQRRSQNLQDVPITMSAVSAEKLEASGVSSTLDLPTITPGLSMTATRNGITPYLRGVGTQSSTAEQAVAVYIDNIYIASTAAAVFNLNNVERVEVLKGPQGTLFGRNATGGLINVITRDPSHTPELDVSAGYGNYNTWTGSVYGTTGLTENIAMDIAAYATHQGDGYGRNLYLNEDVNLNRAYSIRSKIKGDFGSTRVTVAGDYTITHSDFGNARNIAIGTVAAGGLTTFGTIYDTSSGLRSNIHRTAKQWGASVKLEQDIGSNFTLTNTAAYRWNDYPSCTDTDLTPAVGVDGCFDERSKTFQEELLINGKLDRLTLTGGLFFYSYSRGEQPLAVFSTVPARQSWRYTDVLTHSYAAFGQATYALTDRTNLTVGLRYTKEDNKAKGVIRATSYETGAITFDTATRTDGIPNNYSNSKLTWRFSLDHRFSDAMMVYGSVNRGFKSGSYNPFAINDMPTQPETLDAYEVGLKSDLLDRQLRFNLAAYLYNYKNIQVSTILLVGTGDRNAASGRVKGLDAEMVLAPHIPFGHFELRANMTYLDARYRDYSNALANVPNVLIGGVAYSGASLCALANSGQSTAGTLTGGNSTCTVDASGHKMAKAPPLASTVAADYSFPLTDRFDVGANVTWQHTSHFFWDPPGYFRNPSNDLLNAQLSFGPNDGRWRVRLWGRNLTNVEYYTQVGPSASGVGAAAAPPRTYGVAFDVKLGGK